jgi:hypothetical protein
MPIRGPGRNVARYSANVRPFYGLTRPEIDAVLGWNRDSAAKVVHFRMPVFEKCASYRERSRTRRNANSWGQSCRPASLLFSTTQIRVR